MGSHLVPPDSSLACVKDRYLKGGGAALRLGGHAVGGNDELHRMRVSRYFGLIARGQTTVCPLDGPQWGALRKADASAIASVEE